MVQMNRESLVATKSSRERRSSASSRLQSCIQFILISGVIPFVFWSRHFIFLRSNVPDSDYNNNSNNNKYQDELRNNNKFPHYGQFFRSYHYDDVLDKNNNKNKNNKLGDNKEAQRKKQRKQGYSLTKSMLEKNEIVQRGGGDIAQLHYCQFPQHDRHLFWNNFSAWAVPILNQTQMQLWHQLEHTKKRISTKERIITTTNTKSLGTQQSEQVQQQQRRQEEKEPNEQEQQEQIMKQELLLQLLELYAQDHKLCDYNRYRPTLSMVEEEDDNNAEMMRLLNHLRHLTKQQQQSPPPPQQQPTRTTTTTTTTTTLLSPSFHTVSSSQSSSQPPRLVFSIVAHDDFPLLQRMIMALQQPQHVFLIHLERPRTNEAVQFQMAVRQWVNNNNKNNYKNKKQQSTIATTTNVTNVFCITFGTILYSTDTVSLIQWRILNWLLHDIKFTNFDYYVTLDGASFPLWSPQDLLQQLVQSSASTTTTTTRTTTTKTTTTTTAETDNTDKNDQVQPTSPHLVWLGPQLHKGKLLSIPSSESIASSSSSLALQQQYLALLRRKRVFYTTHDTIKLTQRLPRALFGQQDISHNLLNALLVGGKSHSGNTAVYARSVVQQLVESAQVQELFALSKYVAYCCMQERTWRAALYLIHVQPDNNQQQFQSSIPQQQQQQQEEEKELLHGQEEEEHDDLATRNIVFSPPAVFQVYGSDTTTPGVCESSKRNAILITTIIKESETIIPTKLSHGSSNNNNNGTKSPLFCYKLDDATMVQHYHHLQKQQKQEKAGHAVVEQGESNNKNNNKEEYSNKKDDLELLHYLHYWRNFNNQTDSELMTKNASSSNNGGYTFWSNNTLAMLQQARQLGFLFARKFDSSFHESVHLLDRIEQELW